ncbi:hypothetical protein B484DRAFT_403070 [Ochromonadaceae sp. CCMP2298]|nr:hypothetical protein B484DRAFT_403070 [Ochromonadaceae sp. CCMP2298]
MRRVGTVSLPAGLTEEQRLQGNPTIVALRNDHRRSRWLAILGDKAQAKALELRGDRGAYVSFVHFHPFIVYRHYSSCAPAASDPTRRRKGIAFPSALPSTESTNIGGSVLDKIPGSPTHSYLNIPSYTLLALAAEVSRLEFVKCSSLGVASLIATAANFAEVGATLARIELENAELRRRDQLKDAQIHELELDKIKRAKELEGMAGYVNRASLLSDDWHSKNPTAARHYFGFLSWAETRLYLWSLFNVEIPDAMRTGIIDSRTPILPAEQLLICKMRFKK